MNTEAVVVLGAGIMAAFNPCGVVMLPSYIINLIAGRERKLWDGLWAGLLMTSGFLLVFLMVGLISMIFAQVLGVLVLWMGLFVGVGFTILGIRMLWGGNGLSFQIGGNWFGRSGSRTSTFVYGIAYALGSLGCTLPLFSVLVLSSFQAHGLLGGMSDFLLYALGMGFVVTVISLASTISQQFVLDLVRRGARWMGRLSGLITLATGIYLVVYFASYVHLPLPS